MRRFIAGLLITYSTFSLVNSCGPGGRALKAGWPRFINEVEQIPSDSGPTSGSCSCGFSKAENCSWRNIPGEVPSQLGWTVVELKNPQAYANGFRQITGRSDLPVGSFATVASTTPILTQQRAVLRTSLTCHSQNSAQLNLKYWSSSDDVQLRPCIHPIGEAGIEAGSNDLKTQCGPPFSRQDRGIQSRIIIVPDPNTDYNVFLEATGFKDPDFIIVDDIDCQFCGGSRPIRPPTEGALSNCLDLNCNFEQGKICPGWTGRGAGNSNGQWNYGNGRTGNIFDGVRGEFGRDKDLGGYSYVGSEGNVDLNSIYVLQSQDVDLPNGATLLFDLFQRTIRPSPQFQVCVDSTDFCPDNTYTPAPIEADKRWYRDQRVPIPSGIKKVLFVVRNLPSHQYIAVDNVRFTGCGGDNNESAGKFRSTEELEAVTADKAGEELEEIEEEGEGRELSWKTQKFRALIRRKHYIPEDL